MQIKNVHKAWNVFWNAIGILIASVILLASIGYGLLQMPDAKAILIQNIEENFNEGAHRVWKLADLVGIYPSL